MGLFIGQTIYNYFDHMLFLHISEKLNVNVDLKDSFFRFIGLHLECKFGF
jgi:hypothetical protein